MGTIEIDETHVKVEYYVVRADGATPDFGKYVAFFGPYTSVDLARATLVELRENAEMEAGGPRAKIKNYRLVKNTVRSVSEAEIIPD